MNGCYGMRWENNRLVPDENYPIAAEIWSMGLSGWKIQAVATELTRRGIPTPAGKPEWSAYSVRHILKNRTYAGVIEALKTESVEPKVRKAATYGKSGQRVRPEEERIRLAGLVQSPMITEEEFEAMQQRLRENQRLAQKNTKLRIYLLKGLVHCANCGRRYHGVTFDRRGKIHSYYICGQRYKAGPDGEKCRSRTLVAHVVEEAVFAAVVDFLHGPQGFESEMRRRQGITSETEASLRRELESLQRQMKAEQDAEARAFRLAARVEVDEEVYSQEVGLIRTKQRWLEEQRQTVQAQLSDLESHSFDPEAVELLRQRLNDRLARATPEDRRFVLEAVGTRVVVQADGIWELELQVPRIEAGPVDSLQVVNSRPGWNYTVIHI